MTRFLVGGKVLLMTRFFADKMARFFASNSVNSLSLTSH